MNNMNLFKFFTELAKSMNESGNYQQLDFTKKEDVEKLKNQIKKTLSSTEKCVHRLL